MRTQVTAARDIARGEIITLSYTGLRNLQIAPIRGMSTRHNRLFSCRCAE